MLHGKILIDLTKCRNCNDCKADCSYFYHPVNQGIKALLELASFAVTCRRCEDSPCMTVCPSGALEKDEQGIIHRSGNLCVACKSCVAICPFGTLMNDFFSYHSYACDLCLHTEQGALLCLESCREKAISLSGMETADKKGIFPLGESVMVKDVDWATLKNEPEEDFIPNEDII